MAIAKSPISFKSGSIGEMTFSRTGGQTIVRQKQIARKDNRTLAAMTQRAKWLNVTAMQKLLTSPYFRMTFSNKKKSQSDINAFYSKALRLENTPFITKENSERDGVVFAPYMVSEGALPEIKVVANNAYLSVVGVNVQMDIPSGTTESMGLLSSVIIGNDNATFAKGDKLTFVLLYRNTEDGELNRQIVSFILDPDDPRLIADVLRDYDLSYSDGTIGYDGAGEEAALAVVHSRKVEGKVLVSRAILGINSLAADALAAACSDGARDRAIDSIGGLQDAPIVDPDSGNIDLGGGSDDDIVVVRINQHGGGVVKCSAFAEGQSEKAVAKGSRLTFTAVPNEDWQLTKWSDNSTENPHTIVVTEAMVVSATFEEI